MSWIKMLSVNQAPLSGPVCRFRLNNGRELDKEHGCNHDLNCILLPDPFKNKQISTNGYFSISQTYKLVGILRYNLHIKVNVDRAQLRKFITLKTSFEKTAAKTPIYLKKCIFHLESSTWWKNLIISADWWQDLWKFIFSDSCSVTLYFK